MVIRVLETEALACEAASTIFAAQVIRKPDSVLGFATGSTPLGVYRALAALHAKGLLDFSGCVSFNLDEYVGLGADHPCSYRFFMEEQLFSRVNLKASFLPDGRAGNLSAECRRYDAAVRRAGGIDLQLLGIGHNGHIGFNEPSDRFTLGTHAVSLTEDTIRANRRYFLREEDVPRKALTLGIGGIMAARSIVLVALGESKAEAVRGMLKKEMDPRLQASVLRIHPSVTVLLDKGAASRL